MFVSRVSKAPLSTTKSMPPVGRNTEFLAGTFAVTTSSRSPGNERCPRSSHERPAGIDFAEPIAASQDRYFERRAMSASPRNAAGRDRRVSTTPGHRFSAFPQPSGRAFLRRACHRPAGQRRTNYRCRAEFPDYSTPIRAGMPVTFSFKSNIARQQRAYWQ
jgi:hypothetical protein